LAATLKNPMHDRNYEIISRNFQKYSGTQAYCAWHVLATLILPYWAHWFAKRM